MTQEISRVLEHFGAEDVPVSGGWRGIKCPFHQDRHASARISPDDGAFACLACGIKGDALALIMKVERVEFVRALERYEEIVGSPAATVSGKHGGKSGGGVPTRQRNYERDSGLFQTGIRRRPGSGR